MAKNGHGQDVVFAEQDSACVLSPNLESRLRLATANVEELLRQIYAQIAAAEQEILQIKNVIGRAERVPVREANNA